MNFVSPGTWMWFLPAAGAIVLLYMLRMRRKDVVVPASFLWPEKPEEIRANAPFQKLRFSWLLLVQLLAALFLVFALMRPQLASQGLGGSATVIVLDASASMGATDVAPDRFSEAVARARELLRRTTPSDQVALIEAGPTPRVIFPLSNDSASQLRALEDVRRYDMPVDVGESLRLAAELVAGQSSSRIIVLSDGVFPEVKDFAAGSSSVEFEKVGTRSRNVAMESLGSTRTNQGRLLYAAARNTGKEPVEATLTLKADGAVVDSMKQALAPGQLLERTIKVPVDSQAFMAELAATDDLVADNRLVSLASDRQMIRVLLVSPGNLFLERAVALDARVVADVAGTVPDQERRETPGEGAYDLVVFDGTPEVPVKAKAVLVFGGNGEGIVKEPQWAGREASPLLEGVDLDGVYVAEAAPLARDAGRVIAQFKNGAAITERKGEQYVVRVGFAPLASDWPLTPGFPIFIANLLDEVSGEAVGDQLVVSPGRTFGFPAGEATSAVLKTGTTQTTIPAVDGRIVVSQIDRVGASTLTIGKNNYDISAVFRDKFESELAPKDGLVIAGTTVENKSNSVRWGEVWRWVALLAISLLVLEWWLYGRKS